MAVDVGCVRNGTIPVCNRNDVSVVVTAAVGKGIAEIEYGDGVSLCVNGRNSTYGRRRRRGRRRAVLCEDLYCCRLQAVVESKSVVPICSEVSLQVTESPAGNVVSVVNELPAYAGSLQGRGMSCSVGLVDDRPRVSRRLRIIDGIDGPIEIISITSDVGGSVGGAGVGEDATHGVVAPGFGAGTVAHGGAVADGIVVSESRRRGCAAGERDGVVAVFDGGRRTVVEAFLS